MSSPPQSYGKPVPLTDLDSGAFWESLVEHQLRIQRCLDCTTYRWPSRELCHRCQSTRSEMAPVSGQGQVVTWTLVHHATVSGFADELPYCIGLVQLTESADLVLVGAIDVDPSRLRAGTPVRAFYDDVGPDVTLLRWTESDS